MKTERGLRRARAGNAGISFTVGLLMVGALLMGALSLVTSHVLRQELSVAYRTIEKQGRDLESIHQSVTIASEDTTHSGKEMGTQIATLFSEVDKLWASAWRRNKARIETIEESFKKYQESQVLNLKRIDEALVGIEEVFGEAGLADMIKRVRDLDALIKTLEGDRKWMDERFKRNEAWVKSINEWRREYNQRLLRLRDSINSSNRSATDTQNEKSSLEETPL